MCTHTGSPDPAKPEKKETTENTEESRTTSPDTAESKPKEAQEKSQSQPAAFSGAGNRSPKKPAKETAENAETKPGPGQLPQMQPMPGLKKPAKICKPAGKQKNGSLLSLSTLKNPAALRLRLLRIMRSTCRASER